MNEITTKQESEKLLKRATTASVSVAVTLIILKTYGYVESGSVAIFGTLLDSVMDSLSSIIIFAAVRFSMVPADDDHRFGHGKAEAIAGLLQAFVITATSILLMYEVVDKIKNPEEIAKTELGIGIIIASIVLTVLLVIYQRYVAKKTKSIAIEADGMHYTGDILLNLGVAISLVLGGYFNMVYADPLFGGIACLYLLHSAWEVFKASTDVLMDKEMEDDEKEKIISIIKSHDRVIGIHELRTRYSGLNIFIQFHMELENGISLFDAHEISDQVEVKIMENYPTAEVFIHADPEEVVSGSKA
ncbi:cation diffusion facilitator family transporter [Pseudemcibacter aquimaris]|uniref:cation diffusion facilitator family transporter n=1 Tax=Pseudemcibacter aquimaris TaxID=2857064 RepID=UPI002011833B|nr:cation diffusion facilitator family transporter [Pseudemcibacter aquimaris]MCC3861305.1 cation diffusion facilitator family transporter [Pseudemcibacter aquimaris]WDU58079.1 cation diffusion facilitator family transporter [Pseudemcibacter aquimaris]